MNSTKILVAVDGSEYSQNASVNAFWLAKAIKARVEAVTVVDPRIVDLFLSPDFAEDLGLKPSIDASAKIIKALKRIGNVVLDLWKVDCKEHLDVDGKGWLAVGDTTSEILKHGSDCDLTVVGHRGVGYKSHQPSATHFRVGSVAERVAVGAKKSVLIAVEPPSALRSILVAYDGSEPAKGALLLAEQLAVSTGLPLRAIHVVKDESLRAQASSTIELGASLLRQYEPVSNDAGAKESAIGDKSGSVAVQDRTTALMESVFRIQVGAPGKTILDEAKKEEALLVLGSYGFKDPEDNVLGSTTTQIVRSTRTSVLVYRQ